MASKMGYYNVEDFTKQKRQREKEATAPPRANFLAAVNHIRDTFEGKKLNYGVMGGLEMLCLGYQREMPDLHIAYDDRDFHRIKAKLEADQRVRLPEGMNSLFPAKILVRTGPAYKDEGCTQAADVEVDLIPPGSHGTPTSGSLANNIVLLKLKTGGKLRSYKGLNMLYLMKTLVHYCRVRDLAWDPRKDVLFLCQHYGEDVQSIRLQFDQKALQQNFLGTSLFSRLSLEDQRRCYQVLLGTNPPPVMAITPPAPPAGHKHSSSANDISNKPRISSHKSSPSLNAQTSPELLSPPLPGQSDPSRQRTSDVQLQVSELPASTNAHPQIPTEQVTAARESRSRYRPISAPHSRDVSPVDAHIAIPKMRHTRQLSNQLAAPTQSRPSHRASSYQLQPPQNLAPAPAGAHSSKSMPNLNAGPLPPYAFSQTPLLNHPASNPHIYMGPAEMSATPVPSNPGQKHMKLQAGLGGPMPIQRHKDHPIIELPINPQSSIAHQTEHPARAELSASPMPDRRTNQFYVVNPDQSTTLEVQSHAGSLSYPSNKTHAQAPFAPVELDASCPIGQFIAELSVDRATPAPDSHHAHSIPQRTHHQQPSSLPHTPLNLTVLQASPVSPPDPYPAAEQQHSIRPLNPRIHSAPPTMLPTSLMPGGSSTHHRTSSSTSSASASTAIPTTNASRYSRFYASLTPPSSTPASPQQTYKAYHPAPAEMVSLPLDDATKREVQSDDRMSEHEDTTATRNSLGHSRHISGDSAGSEELAREYRIVLPGFGDGYGST